MEKPNNPIKKEVRVLGIDDSPFEKSEKNCLIVGTIFRGGNYIDGLVSTSVEVDGNDATKKLIKLIKKTRHYGQLNCIMLDGIAVAGFNVIEINQLNKKTKLPVIVLMRRLPDLKQIYSALKKMKAQGEIKTEHKMKLIKKAGTIYKTRIGKRNAYFQTAGISPIKAREIINITTTHSLIPEPLRVAHLIASGIVKGESKGRA